ncbi:MAG TPA: DoxX family protein, partial [Prolixibacteraceae bacterium]|nr:DoxX family protein [Prolixibacteraceae bacterium]
MKKYVIYLLTVLRILVGWHFLYEGISKLFIHGWSAKMYLLGSKWLFSGFFHWMASSPDIMKIVDFLNIWGLILIGLSLFVGLFVRWSSALGAMLLLFYFVAYPSISGYTFGTISEGSYLWVNKTMIELFILIVFTGLPSEFYFGADRLIKRWHEEKAHVPIPTLKDETTSFNRRELLRDMISLPFVGAFAYGLYKKRKWDSFEEKILNTNPGGIVPNSHIDASSGATARSLQFSSLQDLKGIMPKGKIGSMEVSRLYLGGNLLNGFAHARDLIYVNKLVKSYHSEERIMMTLQLAEKCGINTLMAIPGNLPFMEKYRRETGGKMQFISDCGWGDFVEGAKLSIDGGATACYAQGGTTD